MIMVVVTQLDNKFVLFTKSKSELEKENHEVTLKELIIVTGFHKWKKRQYSLMEGNRTSLRC